MKKAYFVSDIHLGTMEERNSQNLLRFLHSIAEEEVAPDLYLLGDIFDFWLSNHKVFIEKFKPLWVPLKKLKQRGSRLVYFEGNHDLHIKPFFEKELGFEVHVEAQYENIFGLQVRLEHGDLINLEDEGYLRWRAFTRNPGIVLLAHYLPGRFWKRVGERLSERSRKKSRQYRHNNEDSIRTMIHQHALRAYSQKPFDVLISGHMHVCVDEKIIINSTDIRNINLGSWLEPKTKVLCIEENKTIHWVDI